MLHIWPFFRWLCALCNICSCRSLNCIMLYILPWSSFQSKCQDLPVVTHYQFYRLCHWSRGHWWYYVLVAISEWLIFVGTCSSFHVFGLTSPRFDVDPILDRSKLALGQLTDDLNRSDTRSPLRPAANFPVMLMFLRNLRPIPVIIKK